MCGDPIAKGLMVEALGRPKTLASAMGKPEMGTPVRILDYALRSTREVKIAGSGWRSGRASTILGCRGRRGEGRIASIDAGRQ